MNSITLSRAAYVVTPIHQDIPDTMLDDAFYSSPYAAFILNMNADIIHCNRRAQNRFCGTQSPSRDMVAGRTLAAFTVQTHPEVLALLREGMIQGHLRLSMNRMKGTSNAIEHTFRLSLLRAVNPGEHLYLMTQDHLKTSADALANMNQRRMVASENLMRLKNAHMDLHQSMLQMEAFSRAASHDMRTPLNTMSGLLELFRSSSEKTCPSSQRATCQP